MRHVLCLIVAGCVLTIGVKGQAPSDQTTVTPNDRLVAALWQIATATNTRIGFEATDHTSSWGHPERISPLPFSSLEDGLNAVVDADDRYEWRRVHDVVVVRPKRAWDDPSDPFNRRMRSVQVANETLSDALLALRDFIYTDKFTVVSHPSTMAIPVSFQVRSGTVVDFLNELMIAADNVLWTASYLPLEQRAERNRWQNWDLVLAMRNATHLTTMSGSCKAVIVGRSLCKSPLSP